MPDVLMSDVLDALSKLPEKLDDLEAHLAQIQAISQDNEMKIALGCKEAAKLISVSENTLREWARCGYVPSYKIGTCTKFSRRALSEWAYQMSVQRTRINQGDTT